MTTPDPSFNRWKEEMRQDALERELKRLKHFSSGQSGKIQRLRRSLMFISVSFIALFVLLLANGMIHLPGQEKSAAQAVEKAVTDNPAASAPPETEQPGAPQMPVKVIKPTRDTLTFVLPEDGILFSVQIGAFTGLDLNRFSNNMVSMHQDNFEGINQLSLGVFPQYAEAAEFLEIVKGIGFNDAFVMATRNGQRIKIQEALMRRQTGRISNARPNNNLSEAGTSAQQF